MSNDEPNGEQPKIDMPSMERIQQELSSAKSIDDFFGKDGIFARLFATTLEQMLEAELTAHLGYEKYEAKPIGAEQCAGRSDAMPLSDGRNSGNNRNGRYK